MFLPSFRIGRPILSLALAGGLASGCAADAGGDGATADAQVDPQRDGGRELNDAGSSGGAEGQGGSGGAGGGAGGAGGAPIGGAQGDAGVAESDASPAADAGPLREPDASGVERCAEHPVIDLNAHLAANEGYDGTTVGEAATLAASCGGAAGGEVVFKYRIDAPLDRIVFRTDYPETLSPTVVYVRGRCDEPVDVACNRGSPAAPGTRITLEAPAVGDYYLIVDQGAREMGGAFRLGVETSGASACRDEDDNDGDGLVDLFDPGCEEDLDDSEADPMVVPACADGIDNNANELIDYPADDDCVAAGDTHEGPVCALEVPFVEVGMDGGTFQLPLFTLGNDLAQGRCYAEATPEQLFIVTLDRESTIAVNHQLMGGRLAPATLFARRACDDPASELVCAPPGTPSMSIPAQPPGSYFVFIEASAQNGAVDGQVFGLEFIITPTHKACDDALDNDRDGAIDLEDPGCRTDRDDDEEDPVLRPFCANGVDDDADGQTDFPADDGCTGAGDTCEGVGDDFCGGVCQDVQANVAHCGRCDRACDPGVACIDGRCGALRPVVLACGNPGRSVQNEFIRGELIEAEVRVDLGCVPNDDTQAIVMARGGVNDVVANMAVIRPWLEGGGQLLTEWNTTDEIYNAVFGAALQPGVWNGGCQDNVQPAVQFSPEDPFWQDNVFVPVPGGATGCGYNIQGNLIPDFVPLGGWDANNVSLGYVDVDAGRLWLIEADWQDSEQAFTDESRDLMAYMIGGGRAAPAGPPCANGRDDDRDGLIDLDDPGCAAADSPDEADPAARPVCANGADDDGDGLIDWPSDPGCPGAGAGAEDAEIAAAPACANGVDDDGNGRVDFPDDPGCQGAGDATEEPPARLPACGNTRDDDADGQVDHPFDPGCAAAADADEADPPAPPACANGGDDDADGLIDFPADPGCAAAGDRDDSEQDPRVLPACANGVDDNADGRVDFPWDAGCDFAADATEEAPVMPTACGNGGDDDGDGRIDYPDDLGCAHAADRDEAQPNPTPPRCVDGRDNDLDGRLDLEDVGCEDPRDDDETDPAGDVPYCANGADDDGDGRSDFPDDDGCTGLGDGCEEVAFRLCGGRCMAVEADPANCGRCDNVCAEGVECINGRCGRLRGVVLACGGPGRPVDEFIRGPLVDAGLRVAAGCAPDDDTQAVVVTRQGIGEALNNMATIRPWMQGGGQLLTEYNISDDLYNAVFGGAIPQGGGLGNCQDNVQPAVQFSPDDPFWRANVFAPVPGGQTGCGMAIPGDQIPGFVALGGWDAVNVSLGYVDFDQGRLWMIEADWQDGQAEFTDVSRDLMAYMIGGGLAGGGGPPARPVCANGEDDDGDGRVDLDDLGCEGPADADESDPADGSVPECANGVDDDGDGASDWRSDPDCAAQGDPCESPDDVCARMR